MSEIRESLAVENVKLKASRLFALDALRGLIIVFMALDHANHFIAHKHSPGEYWGGAFPVYYDPLAFITRLVTHLSAPGFFFLMGAGMLLFAVSRRKQGWSEWAILRHFWIRGAVLIALQFLIVNRAWELSPGGWGVSIYVGVLFALGSTMMLGSLLLRLRPAYLLGLSVVLFVGTELLVPDLSAWGPIELANPLDVANPFWIYPGGIPAINLWSNYPILPWLELVTFGMVFGHWVANDPQKAFRRALQLGGAFLVAFVVIRSLDGFGNIRSRLGNDWIDFLNPVKYPPSMTFTLLTMGVNLVLVWLFARVRETWRQFLQPLAVFGQAPLFFYVLHLFLYAGLGYLLTPDGTSIPAMYPYWLLGLLILFPLTLWYGLFKRRRPATSILRFF